jgi:hypothetical protein
MKKLLSIGIAAIMLVVGAMVVCHAQTEPAALNKVPDGVMKTFKSAFPDGKVIKVDVDVENGVTVYDMEFKDGSVEKETDISADGTMLEYTIMVEAKALPAAALKTIEKTAEGSVIKRIERIEISYETKDGKAVKLPKPITHYAADMAKGDQTAEVVVDAAGAVIEPANWAVAKEASEFKSTFEVDKANLTDMGVNPYFILEPGYRLHLAGGGATLTVAVLNETKLVDGVETRVVEEREEKAGQPLEISRNYYAIDKKTNDVYYFGEDVDEFTDGKISSHGGSWVSGVKGAKFGLMMPGKPKQGDKFQQEVAPKVAMDRCEITAVDEELKTPAGTFKTCVRTRDGSAIESGVSEKIYASGVGLVKDDEFVLVKIEKPNR